MYVSTNTTQPVWIVLNMLFLKITSANVISTTTRLVVPTGGDVLLECCLRLQGFCFCEKERRSFIIWIIKARPRPPFTLMHKHN